MWDIAEVEPSRGSGLLGNDCGFGTPLSVSLDRIFVSFTTSRGNAKSLHNWPTHGRTRAVLPETPKRPHTWACGGGHLDQVSSPMSSIKCPAPRRARSSSNAHSNSDSAGA